MMFNHGREMLAQLNTEECRLGARVALRDSIGTLITGRLDKRSFLPPSEISKRGRPLSSLFMVVGETNPQTGRREGVRDFSPHQILSGNVSLALLEAQPLPGLETSSVSPPLPANSTVEEEANQAPAPSYPPEQDQLFDLQAA